MSQAVVGPRTVSGKKPVAATAAKKDPKPKREPIQPLIFYLILEFSRPVAWVPAIAPLKLGMIGAGWGLAWTLMYRKRPFPRMLWYVIAFAALLVYQVPAATNNFFAYQVMFNFMIILFGLLIPLSVLPGSIDAMRTLLQTYVLSHVPMALYGLLHGGRGQGGWVGDENDLAFALNAAIGLGVFMLLDAGKGWMKRFIGIGLILMLIAVVATNSRGGFIGLVAVGAFIFYKVDRRFRGRIVMMILIGVLALVAFAPADYWEEIRSITSAGEHGDTGDKRQYYWGMGWRMFLDHPIAGVGSANFGIRAPEYEDRSRYHRSTWKRAAHSLYFTLIPEQGLIGIFLFLAMVRCFWNSHKKFAYQFRKNPDSEEVRSATLMSTGLLSALVGVLVTGTFLSVLYYPAFWILVCLMGSLDAVRPSVAEEAEA